MRIVPMSAPYAVAITAWRYPPPYDCYDMTGADPDFLASPASGFFALLDGNELMGFRSFGQDGQVPGWDYDETALDTGGGLRPDLTGRGLGRQAIRTGLDFGRSRFSPPVFRMTIAAFNQRAQRVVEALGFRKARSFQGSADGRSYEVLLRQEAY
jgi:[ribosomal protein S18]-alanine N-acetyltransferase